MRVDTFVIASVLLAACAPAPPANPTAPEATAPQAGPAATEIPGAAPAATASDEAEVRAVVEGFGQRLKNVSLLFPTASADIRQQYAGYVSDELLQAWAGGIASPPGRLVSSPWPDRIELATIVQVAPGTYGVTGEVVEVTSAEAAREGAAARWPVEIVVERVDGRWLITHWSMVAGG